MTPTLREMFVLDEAPVAPVVVESPTDDRRVLHAALVLLEWAQATWQDQGQGELASRGERALDALGRARGGLASVKDPVWALVLVAHDLMARARRKPSVSQPEMARLLLYARKRLGLDVNRLFVDEED